MTSADRIRADRIRVDWVPRATPLTPRGVAAWGAAARALGRRLLALDDAALGALTAVASPELLVVLGEASTLPWVDGAGYLGRDDAAPGLLLPTAASPTVPVAVLEAAIFARGLAETERSPEHRAKPEAPDRRNEGSAESDVRGGRMNYGLLAGSVAGPVAVLAGPARLVPCGLARAIDRARLAAWLAAWPETTCT